MVLPTPTGQFKDADLKKKKKRVTNGKGTQIPEFSLIYVRSITKPQLSSSEGIRSAESTSKAPSPAWDSQFQNIFAVKQLKKINIPSQAEISHKLFLKWR